MIRLLPLLLAAGCVGGPSKDADAGEAGDSGDPSDTDDTGATDTRDTVPDDTGPVPDETGGGPDDSATGTDTDGTDTDHTDAPEPDRGPCTEHANVAAWNLGSGALFSAVQAAIASAADGDTIVVCPGDHVEALSLPAATLTVWGYGADESVLDGGTTRRVMEVPDGATLTLSDLAVRDGLATGEDLKGGGIFAGDVTLALTRVTVSGGSADYGAGLCQEEGTLELQDVAFEANTADTGGGGLAYFGTGVVTLSDVAFTGNAADLGAGAWANGLSETVVTGAVFEDNDALSYGGGLYFGGNQGGGTLAISGTTFSGNEAEQGAGLYAGGWNQPTITVDASLFEDNVAAYGGAAVSLHATFGATLDATDTTFLRNEARVAGGALHVDAVREGSTTIRFQGCELAENSAGTGGAIATSSGAVDIVVDGGTVDSNAAIFGGGALAFGESTTVTVTASDWGTDATDNTPDDVDGVDAAYGADASFTCSSGTCY